MERLRGELARFAASSPSKNGTLIALAQVGDAPAEEASEAVPFSSSRRWSALRLGGEGFVLGAPELFPLGPLAGTWRSRSSGQGRKSSLSDDNRRVQPVRTA